MERSADDSPPPYLGDYLHGKYWSAFRPDGSVDNDDEAEDFTVEGTLLRIMRDEGARPCGAMRSCSLTTRMAAAGAGPQRLSDRGPACVGARHGRGSRTWPVAGTSQLSRPATDCAPASEVRSRFRVRFHR